MAVGQQDVSLAKRLEALLDHLGLAAAHFCARSPQEMLSLALADPHRVASVTFVGANGRPEEFVSLGPRICWINGDGGSVGAIMAPRLKALPAGQVHLLAGYDEFQWSSTISDRADEVANAVLSFIEATESAAPTRPAKAAGSGDVAGISYVTAGSGPPVILLPLGLAATQWDALLPRLQEHYTTIVLGGPHLAPVEMLESRAKSDYARVPLGMLAMADPNPTDALIEVGCGSGALLRRIVQQHGMNRVVGLDVNRFLLREAAALARDEGIADRIALHEGSAEEIPFENATFDIVFSSTVMEEVDADRMMAELVRIAKPGGRVVVIVRAVDRGSWTNAPVSAAVRAQVETTATTGGMDQRGCADESLYRRFHDAGLGNIRGIPSWASVGPTEPWWSNIDDQIRGRLSPADAAEWGQAVADARARSFPLWVARPFHCAIGTKR